MYDYLFMTYEAFASPAIAGNNRYYAAVNYEPSKLSGFTQVKGRKHLTKKKRKQLKTCK